MKKFRPYVGPPRASVLSVEAATRLVGRIRVQERRDRHEFDHSIEEASELHEPELVARVFTVHRSDGCRQVDVRIPVAQFPELEPAREEARRLGLELLITDARGIPADPPASDG